MTRGGSAVWASWALCSWSQGFSALNHYWNHLWSFKNIPILGSHCRPINSEPPGVGLGDQDGSKKPQMALRCSLGWKLLLSWYHSHSNPQWKVQQLPGFYTEKAGANRGSWSRVKWLLAVEAGFEPTAHTPNHRAALWPPNLRFSACRALNLYALFQVENGDSHTIFTCYFKKILMEMKR